jgi:hypothetical protein
MQSIIWLIGSAGISLSRFTPNLQPVRGATHNVIVEFGWEGSWFEAGIVLFKHACQ